MIISSLHFSWTGMLLAFVAYFALGALWFTLLFAKAYKRSLGKEELNNRAPIFIVGPAICTFVITLTTALLIAALGIHSFAELPAFCLLTGFGYLVANTMNIAINPNIPRPVLYGIISGAYHLVGILLASAIIVAMS